MSGNVGNVLHRLRVSLSRDLVEQSIAQRLAAAAVPTALLWLVIWWDLDLPSGPAIVLVAELSHMLSVLLGPRDSPRAIYLRMPVRGLLEEFRNVNSCSQEPS
jgi:hypothetical protein